MDDSCIVVFTSRTVQRMLADGGSLAWKLGNAARRCPYLVCTWNSHGEYANPNEGLVHGQAFLVAPIAAIEPALLPQHAGRYIIQFNEYARISIPNVWNGQRNPVWYSSLRTLGVDLNGLHFDRVEAAARSASLAQQSSVAPLTITAAKQGLAVNYAVDPSDIEITIRG